MKQHGTIIVPLDGSKVAEAILPEVETVARAFNSTITIVRAFHGRSEKAQIDRSREVEKYVDKIKKRLEAKGFDVNNSHTPFTTDVAQAILESSENADLIMMSTHGHSGIKRQLLGSVAEEVVHHATTPVYLVRSVLK